MIVVCTKIHLSGSGTCATTSPGVDGLDAVRTAWSCCPPLLAMDAGQSLSESNLLLTATPKEPVFLKAIINLPSLPNARQPRSAF
jgi:hypothetical protein